MPAAHPEVFQRVLEGERERNARQLNAVRFVVATLFLVVRVFNVSCGDHLDFANFPSFLLAYWVVAGLLWIAARRSLRMARLCALTVPFLDIPFVYLTQRYDYAWTDPESRAIANFALGPMVLLVMLSAFMLRPLQIVLAGLMAMGLQLALQLDAHDPLDGLLGGMVVIGTTTALCLFALARRLEMVRFLAEGEMHRERLRRYFSPGVSEQVNAAPDDLATGQGHEVTVLMADLTDFANVTKKLNPAGVTAFLNDFQTRMAEAVFAENGALDKFTGGGALAWFGPPGPAQDHPARALRCALAMQAAMVGLLESHPAASQPPLRLGIGLHTGSVVIGFINSGTRRDLTAVGEAVTLASRLERLTRTYHERILLSGETARRLGDTFRLRFVAETHVRGRNQPVQLHTPAAAADAPAV